jgi:hypothetical protein
MRKNLAHTNTHKKEKVKRKEYINKFIAITNQLEFVGVSSSDTIKLDSV